jgi:hypothetical protein
VRSGDFVSLVASEQERETLERMQATMAVLEGHAEHVMDAVGAPLLPSLPRLRAALDARRKSQSAPARLLQRLLGLEMKLKQYAQGKRFCDAVVREVGGGAASRLGCARDAAVHCRAGRAHAVAGANRRSTSPERLSQLLQGFYASITARCNHPPAAAYKQVFERAEGFRRAH